MGQPLKPCPFCGGTNVEVKEWKHPNANLWCAQVDCLSCGISGNTRSADNSHSGNPDLAVPAAIAAWNTRAPSPAPSADVVEQLAKSFFDKRRELDGGGCTWEELHETRKHEWREPAKAVLATLPISTLSESEAVEVAYTAYMGETGINVHAQLRAAIQALRNAGIQFREGK